MNYFKFADIYVMILMFVPFAWFVWLLAKYLATFTRFGCWITRRHKPVQVGFLLDMREDVRANIPLAFCSRCHKVL